MRVQDGSRDVRVLRRAQESEQEKGQEQEVLGHG